MNLASAVYLTDIGAKSPKREFHNPLWNSLPGQCVSAEYINLSLYIFHGCPPLYKEGDPDKTITKIIYQNYLPWEIP